MNLLAFLAGWRLGRRLRPAARPYTGPTLPSVEPSRPIPAMPLQPQDVVVIIFPSRGWEIKQEEARRG